MEVELHLTSILSDMKIKFVNKETGKLIGGVPFEVEVSGAKSFQWKDDDKDGVIYQKDIAAGSYEVKILPLSGGAAESIRSLEEQQRQGDRQDRLPEGGCGGRGEDRGGDQCGQGGSHPAEYRSGIRSAGYRGVGGVHEDSDRR